MFTNSDQYIGDWVDDQRTGRGTYVYASGSVFVGTWDIAMPVNAHYGSARHSQA
jgi:hypothetical protein